MTTRLGRRGRRGSVGVEALLILPVFLALFAFVVQGVWVLLAMNAVNYASFQAARTAALNHHGPYFDHLAEDTAAGLSKPDLYNEPMTLSRDARYAAWWEAWSIVSPFHLVWDAGLAPVDFMSDPGATPTSTLWGPSDAYMYNTDPGVGKTPEVPLVVLVAILRGGTKPPTNPADPVINHYRTKETTGPVVHAEVTYWMPLWVPLGREVFAYCLPQYDGVDAGRTIQKGPSWARMVDDAANMEKAGHVFRIRRFGTRLTPHVGIRQWSQIPKLWS